MNRQRILLILAVLTLLVAGLVVPVASAQEGTCIAQGVYFQACWVADNQLEILRIDGGQGNRMGVIPGEIYAYAATNLTSPQLLYTLSDGSGYSLEVYFTGKQMAPVNGYDTTWTLVYYGPAGQLTRTDYTKRAAADPTVSLSFAAAARPVSGDSAASAPASVPVTGVYEPSIVQGGTVENCLVRSTYTVRMRQAPTTGSVLMDRVPYDTSMPADLITTDGQWVRAFFVAEGGVGKLGWIFARYLDLSEACDGLATVMPLGGGANVAALVAAGGTSAADAASDEPAPVAQGEDFDPTFGGQLDLTVTQSGSVGTCLVRTTYTVRMRAMPGVNAPEMDNVPYRASMPADLVTSDGEWVRANYLGALGWINARYLSLSEACEGLSTIAPME